MHLHIVTALGMLAAAALAGPLHELPDEKLFKERAADATACPKVVIYGVRGSSDNPTLTVDPAIYSALPAAFTKIAQAAIAKAGGGYMQAIAYPASDGTVNGGANYSPSVASGIASLQDTIYNFIKQCSTGKIVVLGFSQGAQVVSGALAGSRYRGPLKAKGRITAGAIFADPTFQDNRNPVDQGDGAFNGRNGAVPGDGSKYNFLNKYFATRVRSYCQLEDKFCDSGTATNAVAIHTNAPDKYEPDAQTWITGLL